MRIFIALALLATLAIYASAQGCPNTYTGCSYTRSTELVNWLTGLNSALNPLQNPFTDCITNSEMNAYWNVYYNANGGKVPYAPSGNGFLNFCKNAQGKYCYATMNANCNCLKYCDQVDAAQGMVAAN